MNCAHDHPTLRAILQRRIRVRPSVRALRLHRVVLDLYPGVFAYGIIHVPRDIKPDERRPVAVCQHGLEGRPQDAADPSIDNEFHHRFAYRLAQRGFVTFRLKTRTSANIDFGKFSGAPNHFNSRCFHSSSDSMNESSSGWPPRLMSTQEE